MAQNVTLVPPGANDHRVIEIDSGTTDASAGGIAFDIPRPQVQVQMAQRAPPQQQPQQLQQPQQRRPPQQRFYRQPPPPPSPSPMPPQPEELNDFANPHKIDDSPEEEEGSPEEFEEQQQYDEHQEYDEQPEGYEYPPTPMQPALQPLPPFQTLEDERADLMFRLQRASKNGINVRSNFSWNADIRELRVEAARARAEQEISTSIAFQRHMLMMICTGLEFANKHWSYFDLELDGWSTSMMDDIGKFDVIFEKLHKKHAGNFNLPPELQLIFMIGGSAITWSMIAKSAKQSAKDRSKKRQRRYDSSDSSDSESDRERERRKYAKPRSPPQTRNPPPKPNKPNQRREMQGPGFDPSGLVGGLGGLSGLSGAFPQVPVPDLRPKFSRPGKVTVTEIEASPDDNSDRLSDVPSEDLDDVPSSFGGSPTESTENTKVVEVPEQKKKRAPRKKAADTKKVVVI
jgi:hypothetical protein